MKETKRTDYISWDKYFMGIALLSAMRSKDPSTQVGACIVDNDNKIVSVGYNGMPNGCNDDDLPWGKSEKEILDNKYPYVCHAELNAILNTHTGATRFSKIYTTLFPCNECAKAIIQSGIKHVIYLTSKGFNNISEVATLKLFDAAGITYTRYNYDLDFIKLVYDD